MNLLSLFVLAIVSLTVLPGEGSADVVRGKGEVVGEAGGAPDDDGIAGHGAHARTVRRASRDKVVKVQANLAKI